MIMLMSWFRVYIVAFFGCFLVSCGNRDALEVRQFTLRDTDSAWSDDLMIRGEIQRHLFGAVEASERELRKGQYYQVRWRAPRSGGPVKVIFQYQQAQTGSRTQILEKIVSPERDTGVVEFAVNGEAYRDGGRVLAWQAIAEQGGVELGRKQSFQWQ